MLDDFFARHPLSKHVKNEIKASLRPCCERRRVARAVPGSAGHRSAGPLFLGTPVLFRQERPGLHGRPFQLVKFRTMTDAKDAEGRLFPDADRLTRFGKFLRSTSLDELPELWNVLKGDMSLVGPRPLLTEYLPLYSARQARRHEVKPGLTGWAQVNGRNALDLGGPIGDGCLVRGKPIPLAGPENHLDDARDRAKSKGNQPRRQCDDGAVSGSVQPGDS